jgi:hypothetical protein
MMIRRLRPLAALVVLVGAAGLFADDANKPKAESKTDEYYPTALGTTWHYKIGEKKATAKVTELSKEGVAKIVTTMDDKPVAEEEVAHTPEGIARLSYGGEKSKTPVLIWKAGAKKGDKWEVKTDLNGTPIEGTFTAGEDKAKVPAGEFDCVTATGEFKLLGKDAKFIYWFAKDKGVVKLQMTVEGQDILLELEKFEPGK